MKKPRQANPALKRANRMRQDALGGPLQCSTQCLLKGAWLPGQDEIQRFELTNLVRTLTGDIELSLASVERIWTNLKGGNHVILRNHICLCIIYQQQNLHLLFFHFDVYFGIHYLLICGKMLSLIS